MMIPPESEQRESTRGVLRLVREARRSRLARALLNLALLILAGLLGSACSVPVGADTGLEAAPPQSVMTLSETRL